jgi:hypothetical protein
MSDVNAFIQGKYQEVEQNASALSTVLHGVFRTPPQMPSATGVFQNGRDLTRPPGAPITVNVAPASAGSATVVLDDKIELCHFGTVYLDRASAFGHDTLDDADPSVDLASQLGGHAIEYRAALERESILMAGFLAAHKAALAERTKDESTMGKVLAAIGSLLGGGGGVGDTAQNEDLNPFVTKIQTIGGQIDVDPITYDVTHQAGIDLHDLRASYVQYLNAQLDAQKNLTPEAGLLSTIPMLSHALPKEIGNIFTLVEKMSTKAFDIYVKLILGLTRTLMPVIETACRDITIDAITTKKTPMFDVWFPPKDQQADTSEPLLSAPKAPPATGIGPVDKLVGQAMGTVTGAVKEIDTTAAPYVDFLTKPGKPAPGGPFLDQVFAPIADNSAYLKTAAGVSSIGELMRVAIEQAFGFSAGELPGFVEGFVTRICLVLADFLRGVYGTLISLDPTAPIVEGDLVEAGREHLLDQSIEAIVHSITFLEKIRSFRFNLNLFGPIEKTLSGDALFQRGKELLNHELGPHLDPIIEKVMKDFAGVLEGARQEAKGAMTMEVYLSRLPHLYALLFRKTFFPIWDLLVESVFKPVSDLLNPMTGDVEGLAKKAKGIVDDVRTGLLRASKVIDTALSKGLQGGLTGTNLGDYQKDLKATLTGDPAPPPNVTPAATTFPLPSRKSTGVGTAVDDTVLDTVRPNDKWKDPPSATATADQQQDDSKQDGSQTSP